MATVPISNDATNVDSASGVLDIGDVRIQWGLGNADGVTKTFPQPFANASIVLMVSENNSAFSDRSMHGGATSSTQYTLASYNVASHATSNAGEGVNWIAIGVKP